MACQVTRYFANRACLARWEDNFPRYRRINCADAKTMAGSSTGANYVQFWFHRFRSGIFDVKDAPRTGRPVVENVDKITEIIEIDRHVISRSIIQDRP
ncbi:histone-lysine N-methyltransferase SETMAR [Trichonephila clavipes]|nr:histone-lysine N-methyltransferase SETMAR [Trichonephila clavipes]